MLRGVDVSSHQPVIDWARVKAAGIDFAWIKCAGDQGYANPYYRQQLAGARAQGVLTAHYYYDDPGWADVATRVRHFLDHLDRRDGEPICLDVEERGTGQDVEAATLDWLRRVEAATGIRPLVYTYPSFIPENRLRSPELARYPLWFAFYKEPRSDRGWPAAPAPWGRVIIWQWTADGRIPGIPGTVVDLNIFRGGRDDFMALGRAEVEAFTRAPTWGRRWLRGGSFAERVGA